MKLPLTDSSVRVSVQKIFWFSKLGYRCEAFASLQNTDASSCSQQMLAETGAGSVFSSLQLLYIMTHYSSPLDHLRMLFISHSDSCMYLDIYDLHMDIHLLTEAQCLPYTGTFMQVHISVLSDFYLHGS